VADPFVRHRCIFESFVGLEAVHRLCYEEKLAQSLSTLPLGKMYDIGEGGNATLVEVERSTTGLGERYDSIVKLIENAKFTGAGDEKKVRQSVPCERMLITLSTVGAAAATLGSM
jgi:hypothetical protein